MLRYCQPDGLIVEPERSRITITEIKLRHTSDAYVQVTGIYDPVVRRLFPGWDIRHVEVCRWYDAGIPFPVPPILVSNLDLCPKAGFGVHIWKP